MKKGSSSSASRSSADPKPPASSAVSKPADGRRSARTEDTGASPPPDAAEQTRLFEEAVSLFQAGKFLEAKQGFDRAALGPLVEMAHAARQRARICEARLIRQEPELRTAEDFYNYAVVLLNARRWQEAEAHLERALTQEPDGDHLYYALALCRCWRGDLQSAAELMRRAIELQPKNWIAARNDPDFAPFLNQPPLAEILDPEPNRPK